MTATTVTAPSATHELKLTGDNLGVAVATLVAHPLSHSKLWPGSYRGRRQRRNVKLAGYWGRAMIDRVSLH
jgi:hypothetical protein